MITSFLRATTPIFIFVCLALSQAIAQDAKIDIKKIEIEEARAGDVHENNSSNYLLKEDWKQIMVEFEVTSDTDDKMVEEVTFQFYVWAFDLLEDEEEVTLVAESTFINVPDGDDQYVAVYLSPTAQHRYGGKDGAKFFKKSGSKDFNIHVKAMIKGREVGSLDLIKSGFEEDWYRDGKQVRDILLEAKDSPWWPQESLRFNQYKASNR